MNTRTTEEIAEIKPRWAHPAGTVVYSGLGRTTLYNLMAAGEIKSVRIAKNNSKHGRAHRLIDLRSVDAWIEKHMGNGGENA